MAAIAVTAIAGPENGLLMALAMGGGLLFAPALPRRLLLLTRQAQRLTGRDAAGLVAPLAELARRAGLQRAPALYQVPSRLPNAFALGSPEDSAICVTDGLLGLLDGRELAGVLAHEIGHIANRDLWIMSLADMMSRLVSLASWLGQQNGDLSEGRSSREGCLSGPSPPPLGLAKPISLQGGIPIFSLFSRVMAVRHFTDDGHSGPKSVLCLRISPKLLPESFAVKLFYLTVFSV